MHSLWKRMDLAQMASLVDRLDTPCFGYSGLEHNYTTDGQVELNTMT
jgi:hypothetical protein